MENKNILINFIQNIGNKNRERKNSPVLIFLYIKREDKLMIPNIDKITDIVHKEDINNIIDAINNLKNLIDNLPQEIKDELLVIINDKTQIMKGATEKEAGTSGLTPVPAAGSVERFLSSDGTWKEPDIPENLSDLINDTGFITQDDVPKKISDLVNDSNFIDKQEFLKEYNGTLNNLKNQVNGWYKWTGTIYGVNGNWIIIKMDTLYTATNLEDPRLVVNSNDLTTWYSIYGYWHA